jgi:hypothetical protein
MKASEAIEKIKQNKIEKSMLKLIYDEINQAVERGWYNTFIREFNISKEDKLSLEGDGYLVDTRYTRGFTVRWFESDKKYFEDLITSSKKYGYLKIDDDVVEKYSILQGFK